MSMVVRTNAMALNANNALNKNNSTVAGNLEKLSSGFKINRAADDASGLAISEKMKAQIKALDQASKNAEDGASLIKTAEGYMGEVHDMLNRIVELAEKSANGTFETVEDGVDAETYGAAGIDRQALQDEVDQLTTEIDRIAKTANFNELKLMDGSLEVKTTTTPGEVSYTAATVTRPTADSYSTATVEDGASVEGLYTKDGDNYVAASGTKQADTTYYSKTAGSAGSSVAGLYTKDGDDYVAASGTADASTTYYTKNVGDATVTTEGKGLKLQIGETSDAADRLEVSIKSFKTADLFADVADKTANKSEAAQTAGFVAEEGDTEAYQGQTLNISNQDAAARVAESVRDVINDVSAQRAKLGAMENRLDYTINNLTTASENITDANSRIRDTDMAKTMMQYTQGNVLTQAAQAMLAQANQAPSQVLQLLQ